MKLFMMLFVIILLFTSCGVVMEDLRLKGTWTLDTVYFYTTNNALDTTNTYISNNATTPSESNPAIGEFFADKTKVSFVITFDDSNAFSVGGGNPVVFIVDPSKGEWYINKYDNSLTIYIASNSSGSGFWGTGFTIKNSWPMTDYNTLEITIKASDVGDRYFSVSLANKTIRVNSMKGIFKKN